MLKIILYIKVIRIMNKLNNKSPLRYPGGKTRACKKLEEILLENYDISKYNEIVSPFLGGGSFEFYIQNNYGLKIIANDKFQPLYNFWKSCTDDYCKNIIVNNLIQNLNTVSKDKFKHTRETIIKEKNNLKQAVDYFIINRCSFSGATLCGGFSEEASNKRFTKSSIEKIEKLDLSNFTITKKDFSEFLNDNIEKESSILFLDPPYYLEKSTLYGNNGDMHENFDHDGLHKMLSSRKNWILTYNNIPYIRELYKNFKIIETSWSYGMNKSKKSSEIVILG